MAIKRNITRRQFLKGTSAASLGLALANSGFDFRRARAQEDLIKIMETGANLPTGDVDFRWVDSGDQKAVFWNTFFPKYQEAHPNINVMYDALPWNEIAQVVPLGVRGGTAHDVFQIPLNLTLAQVVNEGWVAPLDDIIPDFENWKAGFPAGVFVEGITGFEGKTYAFPMTSNKRYSTHLLYNVEYLQDAGYDPSETVLSADEFVDAAKKITEAGGGRYYGFIVGGNQRNRWGDIVQFFATMAGAPLGAGQFQVNFLTGEYIYADPLFIEAIDVLLRLRDDGSVFPGSLSINAPQARANMPQGFAGMILQGPWNIPIWLRENPDFNFDISPQPLLNPDAPLNPIPVPPGGANTVHVFAESKVKEVAGDIFYHLGTLEGQIAWATLVGAADPAQFAEAIELADMHSLERKALQMFNRDVRVCPSPVVKNPEVSKVALEFVAPDPNLADIVQGIYTGQVGDKQKALQELQDAYNIELDRAIKAAQDKGAVVTRDDFVFPNWDTTQDYGEADYAAL